MSAWLFFRDIHARSNHQSSLSMSSRNYPFANLAALLKAKDWICGALELPHRRVINETGVLSSTVFASALHSIETSIMLDCRLTPEVGQLDLSTVLHSRFMSADASACPVDRLIDVGEWFASLRDAGHEFMN